MIVATAQSPVSGSIRENGKTVRSLMRRAARLGARLVHFPEGAVSGSTRDDIESWRTSGFDEVHDELCLIGETASSLGIWVVVGSVHALSPPNRPHNSLFVFSDSGELHTRYDERFCSNTKITSLFTPGFDPCVFDVDGTRFGCALGLEIHFPHLFAEANDRGVHCLLFSTYSKDPMFAVQARAMAGIYNYWLSFSNSTNASGEVPGRFIGPDGHETARCRRGRASVVLNQIVMDAPEWDIPLRRARPWRATAREGAIYAARRVSDPRSAQKTMI